MSNLRPLERVIVRLARDNVSKVEIGRRVGKKPGTIARILEMVEYKSGRPAAEASTAPTLRPIERVVLRLRDNGESYGEIGNRLARSGPHVRRIESYAKLKTE